MLDFINLEQSAPVFMIVGLVLFVAGFLLSGNAKKNNIAGVISMILKTVGLIGIVIAVAYWVTTGISDWNDYAQRML